MQEEALKGQKGRCGEGVVECKWRAGRMRVGHFALQRDGKEDAGGEQWQKSAAEKSDIETVLGHTHH